MDQKIDWVIHLVANGACDECGEIETDFKNNNDKLLDALRKMANDKDN